MATAIHQINRPLSAVTADLLGTRQRLRHLDERVRGRELTDDEDARYEALNQRVGALEREFDAAFYAETGVSWQIAEGARL